MIDKEAALARLGGDEELYQEIVLIFLDDAPKQISSLKEAFNLSDYQTAMRVAHSLKSASASVGAVSFQKIAFKIEKLLSENDVDQAKKHFEGLVSSFDELKDLLK